MHLSKENGDNMLFSEKQREKERALGTARNNFHKLKAILLKN